MTQLKSMYLGLELAHPIVASSSPLSGTLDGIVQLERAGAAAIVLPSIYQEQIEHEQDARDLLLDQGSWGHPEAAGYFARRARQGDDLETRLSLLREAAKRCHVPIIASLNGSHPQGWTDFAQQLTRAGAVALELNLYRVPAHIEQSGQSVEKQWLETVKEIRASVEIPLSVKLGPWLSSPGHFIRQLADVGVSGVVLFNRFYQSDIDIRTLIPEASLELSSAQEIRYGLMWLSLLVGRVPLSLAASTGVETHVEVIKYLLAGADVVMTTSALMRHGPEYIGELKRGLIEWMQSHDTRDIRALRGCIAHDRLRDPEPLLRAQYAEALRGESLG